MYCLSYIDYIANVLSVKFDQCLEGVFLERVHIICNSKIVFGMWNFRYTLFIIQLINILNDSRTGPHNKGLNIMIIAHLLILISNKIVIFMNMRDSYMLDIVCTMSLGCWQQGKINKNICCSWFKTNGENSYRIKERTRESKRKRGRERVRKIHQVINTSGSL